MRNFAAQIQDMTGPKDIRIEDYAYCLPEDRIAKYPAAERDASKLLIYNKGRISHTQFRQLPGLLAPGSLLVFNNTRVIQARLRFRKESGASIEIFLLEPLRPRSYEQMFLTTGGCRWLCLIGNRRKWRQEPLTRTLGVGKRSVVLSAEAESAEGSPCAVSFWWNDAGLTFAEIIEAAGELPIPPYLNRKAEDSDNTAYQTVYAKPQGSVAAPTAGLHFTEHVLDELDRRGVQRDEITLHIGAGTFRPVKSDTIGGHEMHREYISVSLASIEKLISHGGRCTAVGTTSARTLESLYWLGAMLGSDPDISEKELAVSQWLPYEYESRKGCRMTATEALGNVKDYIVRSKQPALTASTRLIIVPGYRFRVVDALITNFHQPGSTLLLLIAAFIGSGWRKVYDYALNNGFRFLSYGDSSLLVP